MGPDDTSDLGAADPKPPKHFNPTKLIVAGSLVLLLIIFALVAVLIGNGTDENMATNTGSNEAAEAANIEPVLGYEKVASGFFVPVDLEFGNDAMMVVEKAGIIKNMSNGEVVGDLTDRVYSEPNEMGLLGLAFDPDFEINNYVYVNYSRRSSGSGEGETVIARLVMKDGVIDTSSEKIILTYEQPKSNHNGGDLLFGPDGHLYIMSGDGGGAGDPNANAQNINLLLGKILRIDVRLGDPYTSPDDNPFVGKKGRDEIWTYGWRNPWKASFDPISGDLFVGDVGQKAFEEISRVSQNDSGANFGWDCKEASADFDPENCDEDTAFVSPFISYPHADVERCSGSVTGGYVYRGTQYLNLQGRYIFADYCSGILYQVPIDQPENLSEIETTDFRITTFGVDSDGEIYFADAATGDIYKIVELNEN